MPRPVKCRKVCHFPNVLEFFPADDTEKKTPIILTVDEYETIRLLDKKGYSQEQCAASMQSQEQPFNEFMRLPGRKQQMHSLMDIRLKLKVEISKSVMVRAVTVGLEDVTSRSFIKNMQQKKERVS